jgi:beta-phosphoglucomutase-like phosphatase (HAD superfamily)
MEQLGVTPDETIIYEDSDVGIKAAEKSKAKYIKVTKKWFEV